MGCVLKVVSNSVTYVFVDAVRIGFHLILQAVSNSVTYTHTLVTYKHTLVTYTHTVVTYTHTLVTYTHSGHIHTQWSHTHTHWSHTHSGHIHTQWSHTHTVVMISFDNLPTRVANVLLMPSSARREEGEEGEEGGGRACSLHTRTIWNMFSPYIGGRRQSGPHKPPTRYMLTSPHLLPTNVCSTRVPP